MNKTGNLISKSSFRLGSIWRNCIKYLYFKCCSLLDLALHWSPIVSKNFADSSRQFIFANPDFSSAFSVFSVSSDCASERSIARSTMNFEWKKDQFNVFNVWIIMVNAVFWLTHYKTVVPSDAALISKSYDIVYFPGYYPTAFYLCIVAVFASNAESRRQCGTFSSWSVDPENWIAWYDQHC